MQDENLSGWHKGLFGRTVQHSVLGLVKSKLVKHERVTVLSSREPTTKYCPICGKLKKDITLADRVYECECGYREDRDIHAARNMILLSKKKYLWDAGNLRLWRGRSTLAKTASKTR